MLDKDDPSLTTAHMVQDGLLASNSQQPQSRSRKDLVKSHLVVLFCLAIVLAICGSFLNLIATIRDNLDFWDGPCDLKNATGAERLFAIDTRFGSSFTYVEARGIQILWDFVIGQGGRILHAYVFYKILRDVLVFLLEHSGAPSDLYTSSALQSDQFGTICACFKILAKKRGWTYKILALWALISILHVLGFPILWSAATGYQNPTQSYYELPDGSAVPKGSPDIKYCLKIKDGSRIGSQNGEMIYGGVYFETSDIDNAPEYFQNITAYVQNSWCLNYSANGSYGFSNTTVFPSTYNQSFFPSLSPDPECSSLNADTPNEDNGLVSSSPWVFNSSIKLTPGVIPYNSSITINGTEYRLSAPLLQFISGNDETAESSGYDQMSGVCVNNDFLPSWWSFTNTSFCAFEDGYVWGFSSFMVYMGLIFELIWALSSYSVWLTVNIRSKRLREGSNLSSIYKNACHLSEVMEENLIRDFDTYSDQHLDKEMKKIGYLKWTMDSQDAGLRPRLRMIAQNALKA